MADETITFYHAAPSRGSIVLWMLEEVSAPYRIELLDLGRGDQKRPEYLALNPMGKVPVIVHRHTVVSEVAAICTWLAEQFPAAGLAVEPGSPGRAAYLRWLFFEPGCLEPAIVDRMLQRPAGPPRALGYGDLDTTLAVVAQAVAHGPWLLGERFSTADVLIGSALRWGSMIGAVPERPELAAYLGRLAERPALQRAMAKDRELMAGAAT